MSKTKKKLMKPISISFPSQSVQSDRGVMQRPFFYYYFTRFGTPIAPHGDRVLPLEEIIIIITGTIIMLIFLFARFTGPPTASEPAAAAASSWKPHKRPLTEQIVANICRTSCFRGGTNFSFFFLRCCYCFYSLCVRYKKAQFLISLLIEITTHFGLGPLSVSRAALLHANRRRRRWMDF